MILDVLLSHPGWTYCFWSASAAAAAVLPTLFNFSGKPLNMTPLNGNILCFTGHLCGEFTSPRQFPTQRPVTRSFDVFFDLRLNKRDWYIPLVMLSTWWNFAEILSEIFLTHWGRATHICVSELTIIGSDNGLSPERRQAIIWTNAGILLIGP